MTDDIRPTTSSTAHDTHPKVNSREWLDQLLRDKCQVPSLRAHQLDHGMDVVGGKDVFLVIATGQGKTMVLLSGLIAAQARKEKGIAFMVVPTKALAQQHEQDAKRYGLRAIAITGDTVRKAKTEEGRDLFKEIAEGDDIRLAIVTPQMLRGTRLTQYRNKTEYKKLVRWVLVDEAHLVDDDAASTFLQAYRSIGILRTRLPSSTTWVASVTGTATPDRALEMAKILGFEPGHYVNARYSLDLPNIKYSPRFYELPVSGGNFLDFSFLIPYGLKSLQEIPPTLVFVSTIGVGNQLMNYLDSLLSVFLPDNLRTIRLYNAMMELDYRSEFIRDFEDGSVLRIVIVTDTLTYGLDMRGVYRVVVAELRYSHEQQKQMLGRPGRQGQPAIGVTFCPAWVRDEVITKSSTKKVIEDGKRRDKLPTVIRQWHNSSPGFCCRAADLKYFGEEFDSSTCLCHIHDPAVDPDCALVKQWVDHFAAQEKRARAKTIRSDGTYKRLEASMKVSLTQILQRWRARKWEVIQGGRIGLSSDFYLPPYILARIVDRAHVCLTLPRLEEVSNGWEYFDEHGQDLLTHLTEVMKGFMSILETRMDIDGEGESSEEVETSDGESSELESDLSSDVGTLHVILPPQSAGTAESSRSSRLRLVLRPTHNMSPTETSGTITRDPKRPASPGNSPRKKRQRRNTGKENGQ